MKWLIGIFLMSVSTCGMAQFQFEFAQSYALPYAINPAMSGIEGCLDLKVATRVSLDAAAYAPRTTFAGISVNLESLRYRDGIRASKTKAARNGMSLYVLEDKFGPYSVQEAALGYAFHLPVTSNIYFSTGFAADFTSYRLDVFSLVPENPDDNIYKELLNGASSRTTADLTLGGTLYGDRFYIGYSSFHVVRKTFDNSKWGGTALTVQSVQAGFNFPLSLRTQFYGTGIVRLEGSEMMWDAMAKFRVHDNFWFGASYRSEGSVAGLLGCVIKGLQINYAYNYAYSHTVGWNSHELSVGLLLFRKDKDLLFPFIL